MEDLGLLWWVLRLPGGTEHTRGSDFRFVAKDGMFVSKAEVFASTDFSYSTVLEITPSNRRCLLPLALRSQKAPWASSASPVIRLVACVSAQRWSATGAKIMSKLRQHPTTTRPSSMNLTHAMPRPILDFGPDCPASHDHHQQARKVSAVIEAMPFPAGVGRSIKAFGRILDIHG